MCVCVCRGFPWSQSDGRFFSWRGFPGFVGQPRITTISLRKCGNRRCSYFFLRKHRLRVSARALRARFFRFPIGKETPNAHTNTHARTHTHAHTLAGLRITIEKARRDALKSADVRQFDEFTGPGCVRTRCVLSECVPVMKKGCAC
jgi:hypothetical protein